MLTWRWPVIAVIGIGIIVLEVFEHPNAFRLFDPHFTGEVIFLEGLLIVVGITIGSLLKSIREKTTTVHILESKNNLSQQLTAAQDWDQVTELLVDFPRTILPVNGSSLLIYSPQTDQFELTAYWVSDSSRIEPTNHFQAKDNCTSCPFQDSFQFRLIDSQCSQGKTNNPQLDCYCLPLSSGDSLGAMLHLCLPVEVTPNSDQINLINNLGPEMAIGLKVAQESRTREKLLAEQTAEDVRRGITRDMHDMLAQNLAYIKLKLDQLATDGSIQGTPQMEEQLLRLRDVADESYELVRGTLGALHPNNASRLADILSQHAYTFAEWGNFEIEFTQGGTPQRLDPMVMHNAYQLFREALNNIAKHAGANYVSANLDWQEDEFTISIKDDGRGFDPRVVEQGDHYGLSFMQERIKQLHGQLLSESTPGMGTSITITIPLEGISELSDKTG